MSAAFYQDEVKFYVAVDCIILGFNNKELNAVSYTHLTLPTIA